MTLSSISYKNKFQLILFKLYFGTQADITQKTFLFSLAILKNKDKQVDNK